MSFNNFDSQDELKNFNNFLADNSYVSGYNPSKADSSVFDALKKKTFGDYPHIVRWYNHISSYDSSEVGKWSGGSIPKLGGQQQQQQQPAKSNDDDDVDLFGSDEEEDAEAARIREERVASYAAKKSKKPALIAKSSVLLDVKPWDDETDMKEMEKLVRTIEMDGLLWGASKLVPVGYGINKLQIMCVIEDEKVSIDLLTETIQEFEDFVQSVDIAAFNKI